MLAMDWNFQGTLDILSPPHFPVWQEKQIVEALENPVDIAPLSELAQGKNTACIIVDDLARPTPAGSVIPHLLQQMETAGLPPERVSIVVATGTHGKLPDHLLEKKVGPEAFSRCNIVIHDAKAELAGTGILYGKEELKTNSTFWNAELKLGIGSVLPHSFAGYSGGAKLVLPGLANVQATARSHKFVQMGLRGGQDPNENRFRLEAERLARQMGLEFIVCVFTNQQREITGLVAGDLVTAHRQACVEAEKQFQTPCEPPYDAVLLNAFPKDLDLIQAENVFVCLKKLTQPLLKEDGIYCVTCAASEGIGHHGLFEPGGASYRPPQKKRNLKGRPLWMISPNVREEDARKLLFEDYPFYSDIDQALKDLSMILPKPAKVAVVPCATMQQLINTESKK
ncbi:DUF2088 domain-containing protein [Planctomycetales bacterium 10988]|nr:DUF2088 domain-containing protein [Planctomycetales bacterium 10988]